MAGKKRKAPAPVNTDLVKVERGADHIILRPPETARLKALVPARGGDLDPAGLIAQAQAALDDVSINFGSWMRSEAEKLADARAKFRVHGAASEARRELFQAAHTVRGNAGVFGYPLAGRVADSLARLIDRCPLGELPGALIDKHVDAVRAMVREDERGAGHAAAQELAAALIETTGEFLAVVAPETELGVEANSRMR